MLKENFIEKAKKIHGDKYDYSLVNYKNNKTKVKIICEIHGEFEQTPDKHINKKQGCPKCVGRNKTNEEFIQLIKLKHDNKYDYSLVEYKNNKTKIKVICKEHGVFELTAKDHLSGNGCAKCSGKNKTNDEVINELKKIHDDKYDYSLVKYDNQPTKLKIICKEHGIFKQTFNTHKKGHGCPKCVGRFKSNNDFINEANLKHNNKYNYSLVDYKNSYTKINIICPIHSKFNQSPTQHLQGRGCPKCKGLNITEKKTKTKEQFINEANLVHNNKYDYSLVDYKNCKNKITIICNEHGEFVQTPDSHIQGVGCPKCGLKFDKSENEIKDFIKSLNINIIENDKKILKGLELDIYLPNHNLAIEFDGLYWHNELYKPSNYHLNKTELCEKENIKLIHIFEDEWCFNSDIVKSRLKNILGLIENKIYGRKCIIKEVNSEESKLFLNKNHIQGNTNTSIRLGLYYNEELVSLMTFNKPRLGIGKMGDYYELSRFCNKLNITVIGGASKLLNYFIKNYNPKSIISYADRRWSTGDLYKTLGFTKTRINQPNYWYIIGNKRKHRFGFRKHKLKDGGYDIINKTEHQIMLERKIYRIYDCGTIMYKKDIH